MATPATIRRPMAIDPKKVVAARVALKLTQAGLAAKAGLSQQDVARIENGSRTNPQLSTAERLAIGLDTTVDALLGGKPATTKRGKAPSRRTPPK